MSRVHLAAAIACVTVIVTAARADRAPDPAVGRQIYLSGSGASGRAISASVAGSGELPASLLPCVNCHGADGRGRAEGGVVPSNVTWLELTKPYRAAAANGRRRPAYDDRSLRRAVTEGIDAAGNPLHAAMPRYAMAADDLSDLIAYLRVLGRDEVPGVTATAVRVGTIVPDSAPGDEMLAVLSAYFRDAGPIHGRGVVIERVPPEQLESTLQSQPPFAFVAGLIAGVDERVEKAVEGAAVPLVLPVSIRGDASADNRQRFYLSPGLEEQLHALLRSRAAGIARVVVVAPDDAAAGLARRAIARLDTPPAVVVVPSAGAAELDDATAVLFLDPAAKLADVPTGGTSPLLFLGALLPHDFFERAAAYGGRIRVALTTTPAHLTAGGLAEYRAFAARHPISGTNVASQLAAYAAAKVLVQALKHSGRELTRDGLRASLESLYEFETGVTPPLTFGRGGRIAAPHVHVATIDPQSGAFVPDGTLQTDH